jgi:hypothetical protein
MDKLKMTVEYYQLLIDKFAKTGQSPNQLRVYTEIKELVQNCSSLEEIQDKMKSGGYYESPGQALYMDKMMALKKAADENNFIELASIYQARYDEVKADFNKMYETGYEQKVSAFYSKLSSMLGAFYDIFNNYWGHKSANIFDLGYKSSLETLRENQKKLNSLGTDFRTLAQDPYFRKHIGLEDGDYMIFVAEADSLMNKFDADQSELNQIKTVADAAWGILKDKKSEIQAIGRREEAKSKRSVYMIVPPVSASGKYQFLFNEQEGF